MARAGPAVAPKVVVLNDDVDPADARELLWAFAARCHPLLDHMPFEHERGALKRQIC